MRLELLSERPDAIAALAVGYCAEWPEWYGPGEPGDAEADLRERAGGGLVPFAVVAFEEGRPVGSAAVTASSIASRSHLSPWLTGLWTAPDMRGQGIAGRMIDAVRLEAGSRGISPLFVSTQEGRALFERLGWRFVEWVVEDGRPLAVLVVDPS